MKTISDKNWEALINSQIDNSITQLEILRNILLSQDIEYTTIEVTPDKPKSAYDKAKEEMIKKGLWTQ